MARNDGYVEFQWSLSKPKLGEIQTNASVWIPVGFILRFQQIHFSYGKSCQDREIQLSWTNLRHVRWIHRYSPIRKHCRHVVDYSHVRHDREVQYSQWENSEIDWEHSHWSNLNDKRGEIGNEDSSPTDQVNVQIIPIDITGLTLPIGLMNRLIEQLIRTIHGFTSNLNEQIGWHRASIDLTFVSVQRRELVLMAFARHGRWWWTRGLNSFASASFNKLWSSIVMLAKQSWMAFGKETSSFTRQVISL